MAEDCVSFVFFGSDEGAAAAAAAAAYNKLSEGSDGWGNEIIDGAAAVVDEALSIIRRTLTGLQMVSMFGGRKVVWLKGATFLADTPQGLRSEAVQQAMEDLVAALGHLPADTYFVLSAAEADKRRSCYKKLCKVAEVKEFSKIDISKPGWENELSALAVRQAKPLGLTFSSEALNLFVHRVNESTRQIANEVAKLDVYLGPERRQITVEDVDLMVAVSRNGIVFEIARAVENADCNRAIRLVNEQLDNGEQAVSIMRAALVPMVRNRFCASLLMAEYHLDPTDYRGFESALNRLPLHARKLLPLKKDGNVNTFGLINAARSCKGLKPAKARRDLQACAAADRALVSTGCDARDVLHKLIVSLTATK
ncbi:MAG: DNA polymerase III subunit delta [Akkermansia muciniphila]